MAKKGKSKPRRQYTPILLAAWREYRNKTQEQVAEALHTSIAQISRIETGKRPYTQAFLEAAAEYLETDPASLLMRDPTQPDSIWSIWDRVAEPDKPSALKALSGFAQSKKAG